MIMVQTLTRYNYTRNLSETVDVSAGILTPTVSTCTALLNSALAGVVNALFVFFLVGLATLAIPIVDKLGKPKSSRAHDIENAGAGMFNKRLSTAIAGGLVLYVGGLFALVAYVNVFAASALWKYTLMVILPIWSISGPLLNSPPAPIKIRGPRYILGFATCLAAGIAPLYIWYYLGQVYNIVYFDNVPLSFASSMILIMTVSTWIASRELGLLMQAQAKKTGDFPSLLLDRFSVVTTIALLPSLLLSRTNPFVNFSTLFLALMIVPVVYPMIEMERLQKVKAVLSHIGLLRKFTILAVVGFLAAYLYGPIHPVMLVAVFGSFLTSFSSSLGEMESRCLDPRSMSRLWRPGISRILVALTPIPVWAFFLVTWWYSHLSITIGC